MLDELIVASLKKELGNEKVCVEGSHVSVRSETATDLQQLFQWAASKDIPVYHYAPSCDGSIALDTTHMNRIIEIDTANLVAAVEPGVKLGDLSQELAKQGLRFIPGSTALYQSKTVGELFHEGCSNLFSIKYGFTKHFLMGMEVVLPTGELLKTGAKTVKNVTGYDLTRFLSSPYNNMGIPVKFLLKLLPMPEAKHTAVMAFDGLQDVLGFIEDFRKARITPAAVLWFDPSAQKMLQPGCSSEQQCVMIEMDGVTDEVAKQWSEMLLLAEKYNAVKAQPLPIENLLHAGFTLYDEFKFPVTLEQPFIENIYSCAQEAGVEIGLYGQIAEGKINVLFKTKGVAETQLIEKLLTNAVELGGCCSGKYRRVNGTAAGGALFELEQRIRQSLDPRLILNR